MHTLLDIALVAGGFVIGWAVRAWRGQKGHEKKFLTTSLVEDGRTVAASPMLPSALVELIPVPIVLLDMEGHLRHVNRTAKGLFGDSINAVVRHPAAQAVLAGLPREMIETTLLELDVPVRRVVRASFRRWEKSMRAVGWDFDGVVMVLADHTEAAVVDRIRTDFVAHASHELRTPLASLTGFIETLQGPAANDPAAQQQFLAIMAGQAARMQRLIDRLLYLSRVQRLEHTRPQQMVSAGDITDRVLEETCVMMRNADASLTVEAPEDDIFFPADEDQIVQVLLNLTENAVKYGGSGVAITLSAQPSKRGGVVFAVVDDGEGIEPDHIPRLTERFYRVEKRGKVSPEGTGLGLSIVKHVVDRHGGRLTIDSAPGRGTRCSVWFPPAA